MTAFVPIPFIQADYATYAENVRQLKSRYASYPRAISIETQVRCNAKCGFCPYPSSPRQGEEMSTDLFYKLLDDLAEIPESHVFNIALHRINEPLLDSRMREFHEAFAKQHPQAGHSFFSNGTTLKTGAFEWMGEFAKASLTISLNSMDEDRHKELMGFGLKAVSSNLDYLHELILGDQFKPTVTLCAPHLGDEHSMAFTQACQQRWPKFKIAIRPFFQWMGSTPSGGDHRGVAGLPSNPQSLLLDQLPCGQWFDLHILANGYVTKCCIDETGHRGHARYDIRRNNALAIYRERDDYRDSLPSRCNVRDCQGCFHLG